jgi:hypothetical protein
MTEDFYLSLLGDSTFVFEQLTPLPDELTLQAHWFAGHFGREFTSTSGRVVKIKQFGFWNRGAGPDFKHCAVTIDGEEITGAIELDHASEQWELHGHHQNEGFEDVVVHIVFSGDTLSKFTRTLSNRHIEKVVITPSQLAQAMDQPKLATATAQPGRCAPPLSSADPSKIHALLLAAARRRIMKKARRSIRHRDAHGEEQTLWVQIAETLGYQNNRLAFSLIAHRIPIKALKQKSAHEVLAILFGVADFLSPDLHSKAVPDAQRWIESLWETWWKNRQDFEFISARKVNWVLSGVRPVNHPQRRLAAFAAVASNWSDVVKARKNGKLKKFLAGLDDSFWNYHYTLTSKPSRTKLQLIGESRIDDLLINHILPEQIQDGSDTAWTSYQSYKAPATSEKVNRAIERLFGLRQDKAIILKKAWQHQALLQLYHDFCLEDFSNCQACPFPEQFIRWAEGHTL